MTKITLTILSSLLLGSALATSPVSASQPQSSGKHPFVLHYLLFDVGTFGGNNGAYGEYGTHSLNRHGANVGSMSTGIDDPFCPDWCWGDGYVDHAFEWQDGTTTELGALNDDYSAIAYGINDKGISAGQSENGTVDAATGAPQTRAVLWRRGKIRDLGTLGGTQSMATYINNAGQAAVASLNSDTNDPFLNVPQANCLWNPVNGASCGQFDFAFNTYYEAASTQGHAAIWSKGTGLQDLGTLGGPDSMAYYVNEAGQVIGWSYTSFDAGASGVPDTHPFFRDPATGVTTDIGTLGGTYASVVWMNQSGQATGASNLAGDTVVHPFVWDPASGLMTDIGSFGGWYSHPNWINDNGDVVGISSYPDGTRRAFYWHNGKLKDLGTIGTDDRSTATCVNNKGLIVGYTFTNGGA